MRYGGKAKKAWSELEERFPEIIAEFDVESFDDLHHKDVQDTYNDLFESIVLDEEPNFHEFIDKYGAKGFKDENENVVFSGDDSGWYPFYENSREIRKRLAI